MQVQRQRQPNKCFNPAHAHHTCTLHPAADATSHATDTAACPTSSAGAHSADAADSSTAAAAAHLTANAATNATLKQSLPQPQHDTQLQSPTILILI